LLFCLFKKINYYWITEELIVFDKPGKYPRVTQSLILFLY
jgi:hypothetical protein